MYIQNIYIFACKPHQPPRHVEWIFTTFKHSSKPAEGGVFIWASHRLMQRWDAIVTFFSYLEWRSRDMESCLGYCPLIIPLYSALCRVLSPELTSQRWLQSWERSVWCIAPPCCSPRRLQPRAATVPSNSHPTRVPDPTQLQFVILLHSSLITEWPRGWGSYKLGPLLRLYLAMPPKK